MVARRKEWCVVLTDSESEAPCGEIFKLSVSRSKSLEDLRLCRLFRFPTIAAFENMLVTNTNI